MTNLKESRLDHAERLILGLAEHSHIIQQQVSLNTNAIAQLIETTQQLTVLQSRDSQRFDKSFASISAALERIDHIDVALKRIDRVMDYLMVRDGGEHPSEQ